MYNEYTFYAHSTHIPICSAKAYMFMCGSCLCCVIGFGSPPFYAVLSYKTVACLNLDCYASNNLTFFPPFNDKNPDAETAV